MSDDSQVVVDVDAGGDEAEHLAHSLREWLVKAGIIQPEPSDCVLGEEYGYAPGPRYEAAVETGADQMFLRLRTNGLSIETGRQVFDAGGNGIELTCGTCECG